ncbi:hypothetical protein LGH82_30160 [Mesorhizobium sp. PAMC28654]|uniref:hypothetical protein n=1 Tax=Mesorhizobium sp. PAMC28654 TaxID=2880934 RepID=UPI001D0A1BED|nr:hypothetical protein [Mesorhizobium sp. PAMC28654]UDL89285.1 hypothetical protein LGH82_30160 [Mesorhizobium sp. PAMC28654]
MTPERFAEIVEAYGSRPNRWPQAEREAALAFMNSHPEAVRALRAEASLLDGLLDSSVVAPASRELRQAILQAAPALKVAPFGTIGRAMPKPTLWQRAGFWGAGIVGIGLAGALAGAMTLAIVAPMIGQAYDEGDVHNLTAFNDPLQTADGPTADEQTVDE